MFPIKKLFPLKTILIKYNNKRTKQSLSFTWITHEVGALLQIFFNTPQLIN